MPCIKGFITLREWAAVHFGEGAPSDRLLQCFAKTGAIVPTPVRVGGIYRVDPAATFVEGQQRRQTCLYRHFDAKGRLLYIGISTNPVARLEQHVARSEWADQIAVVTIERFPSRYSALAAEVAAIKRERPLCNLLGNKREPEPYDGDEERAAFDRYLQR